MSDYTQVHNYSAKDSLASGDPNKIVKGSDVDDEFGGIATAIATKANDSAVVHNTGDETIAGNKTLSGNLIMSGKAFVQAEGANVASAATANIWSGDGDTLHITGTTTITSFGTAPQAGAWKKVIFDGVLTLTHGANLNILNGGANVTTAAGDFAFVYADTTTQHDVLYFKANGTPAGGIPASLGGSVVLISSTSASGAASVDFTSGIDSTYDSYIIIGDQIVPSTDNVYVTMQISQAGSFKTDATGYYTALQGLTVAGTSITVAGSAAFFRITDITNGLGNASTKSGGDFTVRLKKPSGTSRFKNVYWNSAYGNSSGTELATIAHGMGYYNVNQAATDGVRFAMSSGNITGNFYLIGIKKQ